MQRNDGVGLTEHSERTANAVNAKKQRQPTK